MKILIFSSDIYFSIIIREIIVLGANIIIQIKDSKSIVVPSGVVSILMSIYLKALWQVSFSCPLVKLKNLVFDIF